MKDGEFEFVYYFNNHFNPFRSFLSLNVAKWKMLSFSVVFFCLQQQTETRIQMIKMVNEFKLTVVHFARPNPMQICACAWIYRWTEKPWKMRRGLPGLRAAGPSRAVAGRGPRAAGPSGRRAAGLLLAKPINKCLEIKFNLSTVAFHEIPVTTSKQTIDLYEFHQMVRVNRFRSFYTANKI